MALNPLNEQLGELLNRKMDRRDFLKHIGIGTLAVFGLGSAVKLVTSLTEAQKAPGSNTQAANKQALAYGGGAYGGKRK